MMTASELPAVVVTRVYLRPAQRTVTAFKGGQQFCAAVAHRVPSWYQRLTGYVHLRVCLHARTCMLS